MNHRLRSALALGLLGLLLTGCRTRPLPAWDLNAPGWTVTEYGALWCPRRGAPELAGELMMARRDDGSQLVQFSKQGIPMVVARIDSGGWEIRSPMDSKVHSGPGTPPRGVLWFLIGPAANSTPLPPPWHKAAGTHGPESWQLSNPSTGEWLEVVP